MIDHVSINVSDRDRSFPFYRDLLGWLGFTLVKETGESLGMRKGESDVWLRQTADKHRDHGFHRKRTGLNHLAFRVPSRQEVDRFCAEFLKPRGIPALYGSPRPFPEYTARYYAVYFEDPDRIKLEVLTR